MSVRTALLYRKNLSTLIDESVSPIILSRVHVRSCRA